MVGDIKNRNFKMNSTTITKMFILNTLHNEKSTYGLDLMEKMQERIGWSMSSSAFYNLLWNMEENQWVKGWWEGATERKNKRYYKITDEGIEHLNRIKLDYKTLIESNLSLMKDIRAVIYK